MKDYNFKNFFKVQALKNQAGMTLIEILIALTLISLMGTFIAGKVFDSLEEGRVKSANIQMKSLESLLKDFRRKCNFYPTTEQGLEALISKPSGGRECRNYPPNGFIDADEIPLDPWDMEYVYTSDGKTYNIMSYGNDNEEGGEGFAKDLYLRDRK
ncbi:type II secretion system major pseudopilin GspG [Halobacteriovorax sp.]|uniref:type II secretion system major pseudopilin GspG n=1 Tax=Halobacteriovorax sp. TaxID=2020862 RepID=UPI003AF22D27